MRICLAQSGFASVSFFCLSDGFGYDRPGFFVDFFQVFLTLEALGVYFIDIFRAGGAGGEPAVFRCYLEAVDRRAVARGGGELCRDFFSRQCLGRDVGGGELFELLLLFARGGGVLRE